MDKEKILLVVDDEQSLCELIAEIFEDDYKVIKAYNGKQALELFWKYKPALVVSDVMMPEMTGLELLERLKNDSSSTKIPVILLSAGIPQSAFQKADAFLKKPFSIDELEDLVRQMLSNINQKKNSMSKAYENELSA